MSHIGFQMTCKSLTSDGFEWSLITHYVLPIVRYCG